VKWIPPPDRILKGATASGALIGEPAQQPVGRTGAVGTDQHVFAIGRGDLRDGTGQDVDVIGHGGGTPSEARGSRTGITRTQRNREHLLGVVAPDCQRVIPETALERRCGTFLLAVRGDQGHVDIQDHDQARSVSAT
jgi:hypothetical protein